MFVFSGKPVLCPWRPPAQSWGPRQSLASSFHVGRPFSSQAAEDQAEAGPLHSVISSSETVQGEAWCGVRPAARGLESTAPLRGVIEAEAVLEGATHSLETEEGLGWREGSPKQCLLRFRLSQHF